VKKANNIFEHTDCISEEKLLKYISNTLSPAEKHEVEKHLIDCELCSDAVEGLQMISDKKKITRITAELNQKIEQRVEKKEVKVIFLKQYRTPLAVAASVILIVGLVWFFRSNMKEMDTVSSEKIFADKFVPPPAEKQMEEKEKVAAGKEQTETDNIAAPATTVERNLEHEPSTGLLSDKQDEKTKVTLQEKKGKDVSSGESFGWSTTSSNNTQAAPSQKSQQIVTKGEKAEEDYRYNKTDAAAKENSNSTTTPDVSAKNANMNFRSEDIALSRKEVSKNQNALIPQSDKDKKDEAKKPESAPSITATGATAGAYDQPVDKKVTLAKQENKKSTDDRERAQKQEGDALALKTEKLSETKSVSEEKSKIKNFKKEKEASPKKVSEGYYETQTITTAAPVPQSQTITKQSEINGKMLDSVSVSSALTSNDVTSNQTNPSDDAMAKYDKQDYTGAITEFEQTLKQNPNDEKSLFYSAVSYLSLGQPDKAITNFNKVLQNKNSNYFDDAQWYLSLAYIKKKDSQNAKRNLIEIQNNSKSKYQKQANETLKEMNK
jgi:hypothetical protein